jgi:hypothetical protein
MLGKNADEGDGKHYAGSQHCIVHDQLFQGGISPEIRFNKVWSSHARPDGAFGLPMEKQPGNIGLLHRAGALGGVHDPNHGR